MLTGVIALDALPAKLVEQQRAVAAQAALRGLEHYQQNVVVRTGNLKDSAELVVDGSVAGIHVTAPYAGFIEARDGTLAEAFEVMLDHLREHGYVGSSA